MRKRFQRGATTVEMTLVGIPIIFMLISIFEISRGMWVYHTLSYAVKEGVRFATVHGKNCGTVGAIVNTCTKTMADVAAVIQAAGVGLDPSTTMLTFTAGGAASAPCSMNACPATLWPPAGSNDPGKSIQIDITTPFQSALAMFWPGAKPVSFASVNFGATSMDTIQF